MALIDPNDEALVAKLREALSRRSAAAYADAMANNIFRADVERILDVLDPAPPEDPRDHMYRDRLARKIAIDNRVQFIDEPSDLFEQCGIVVGLGNKHDDNVVQVRFDGKTIIKPIYPSKLILLTT